MAKGCGISRLGGLVIMGGFLLFGLAGCHDYAWQSPFEDMSELEAAQQKAAAEGKLLLIFYKDWLDKASGRMHAEVLSDNEVGALFKGMDCLLLERGERRSLYGEYMNRFDVTEVPAVILVAPDGRYQKCQGVMSKADFIAWVRQAKKELEGASEAKQ